MKNKPNKSATETKQNDTPRQKGIKSCRNLKEQRLLLIEELVSRRLSKREIAAQLEIIRANPKNTLDLNFDDRTLDRYLHDAYANMAAECAESRKRLVSMGIKNYKKLYNNAVKDGDWKTAGMLLKDFHNFIGLYPED